MGPARLSYTPATLQPAAAAMLTNLSCTARTSRTDTLSLEIAVAAMSRQQAKQTLLRLGHSSQDLFTSVLRAAECTGPTTTRAAVLPVSFYNDFIRMHSPPEKGYGEARDEGGESGVGGSGAEAIEAGKLKRLERASSSEAPKADSSCTEEELSEAVGGLGACLQQLRLASDQSLLKNAAAAEHMLPGAALAAALEPPRVIVESIVQSAAAALEPPRVTDESIPQSAAAAPDHSDSGVASSAPLQLAQAAILPNAATYHNALDPTRVAAHLQRSDGLKILTLEQLMSLAPEQLLPYTESVETCVKSTDRHVQHLALQILWKAHSVSNNCVVLPEAISTILLNEAPAFTWSHPNSALCTFAAECALEMLPKIHQSTEQAKMLLLCSMSTKGAGTLSVFAGFGLVDVRRNIMQHIGNGFGKKCGLAGALMSCLQAHPRYSHSAVHQSLMGATRRTNAPSLTSFILDRLGKCVSRSSSRLQSLFVPAVVTALDDEDDRVRVAACSAIQSFRTGVLEPFAAEIVQLMPNVSKFTQWVTGSIRKTFAHLIDEFSASALCKPSMVNASRVMLQTTTVNAVHLGLRLVQRVLETEAGRKMVAADFELIADIRRAANICFPHRTHRLYEIAQQLVASIEMCSN